MNEVALQPAIVQQHLTMSNLFQPTPPSVGRRGGYEPRGSSTGNATIILIRRLPQNMSREELKSMLLFAKDLQEADFISNDAEDDRYLTAVAHFATLTAANEAQAMLNGKPNTAGKITMIVEVLGPSSNGYGNRRNTVDSAAIRGSTHPVSPPPGVQLPRQSSRFGGAFHSMDRMSPPTSGTPGRDMPGEGAANIQTIFSPHSNLGNAVPEHARNSGKAVINQDSHDDDTGELLKDPVAYMNNDQVNVGPPLSRRSTNPQMPLGRFSNLSLNTNMTSPPSSGYTSPRPGMTMNSPNSAMSPTMGGMGFQNPYHRLNYPPVNPADQNPPCNTLYVGNLPIDTSEDELKTMFSKQRGYKRLCFRTKQNGPMCFVEFEDVSFATKALNELYGAQLHNSVKGGIRLSFSKNPLGVRAGQQSAANPSTPLSPQGPMSGGLGPTSPVGFMTAHGPPPGLTAPTGPGHNWENTPTQHNPGFPDRHGAGPGRGQGPNGTMSPPGMGNIYPDYMMGR